MLLRKSQGHPRTSTAWDYRSAAMLLEGIPRKSQGHPRTFTTWDYRSVAVTREDIPWTSQDTSEYVRNTLTSDGSPKYL